MDEEINTLSKEEEKTLSFVRCQLAKRETNEHSAEDRADDNILEEIPASFHHCPLAGKNDWASRVCCSQPNGVPRSAS